VYQLAGLLYSKIRLGKETPYKLEDFFWMDWIWIGEGEKGGEEEY
jgi:hypothetical protein